MSQKLFAYLFTIGYAFIITQYGIEHSPLTGTAWWTQAFIVGHVVFVPLFVHFAMQRDTYRDTLENISDEVHLERLKELATKIEAIYAERRKWAQEEATAPDPFYYRLAGAMKGGTDDELIRLEDQFNAHLKAARARKMFDGPMSYRDFLPHKKQAPEVVT